MLDSHYDDGNGVEGSSYSALKGNPTPSATVQSPSTAPGTGTGTGTGKPVSLLREFLAEFLGTFILISFGIGSVASDVLSSKLTSVFGSFLAINFGFSMGVLFGVIVAGQVSGAHLNPAVTFSLALHRRLPWRKVGWYVLAQMLGAWMGALAVYIVYLEALDNFDGGSRSIVGANGTASIWVTSPRPFVSTLGGFVDEMFGTALLMLCLFAVIDPKNAVVKKSSHPFVIALIVFAIGVCFGFNTGYAINPARDFAPRLFLSMFGWGTEVFITAHTWCWVPVVAPLVGGAIGSTTYQAFIGWHH